MSTHMRPSFFIVGANKCGTSSLYRYLVAHPNVLPCADKEPNFFGQHPAGYISSHIEDYFALFPTEEYRGPVTLRWEPSDEAGSGGVTTVVVDRRPGRSYITGEASANTFHEVPPALLHEHLPATRIIVLVRNPVDRAWSHHRMYRRFREAGHEFGVEVGEFEADIAAELVAHARGERTHYLAPGFYVDLLEAWEAAYGASNVKVLAADDLARPRRAERTMRELEAYLGLPAHEYAAILDRRFNRAPPAGIPPEARAVLADLYRPYNERLQEHLGRELGWD